MKCLHYLSATILIVLISEGNSGGGHRFGYTKAEQNLWAKKYESCAGKYQSPISISCKKAIALGMPSIEMIGYHNLLPGPLLIHNNGHSVSLSIPKLTKEETQRGERLPYVFGGMLRHEYEIEGLHFHWGYKNNRGSEHVLNDIRYPMEMHIVHRNTKYKDVTEALGYSDGVAVLGFFYQLKETDGPELTHFIRNVANISEYNESILLNSTFSLSSLLGNVDLERFYTYKGSLTTPPCSEAVTWVLFPDTLVASVSQMSKFRRLSNGIEGSVLVDNFRSLQPLGNRRIFVRNVNTKNTPLEVVNTAVHYSKWDWLH